MVKCTSSHSGEAQVRPDKVKVAREVVQHWKSGLDQRDLHKKIVELAELIEHANGHQSSIAQLAPKSPPVFDLP
jgi:hypothetical protein